MIVLLVYIVSFGQRYSLGRLLRVLVSNELTASSENTLARAKMGYAFYFCFKMGAFSLYFKMRFGVKL